MKSILQLVQDSKMEVDKFIASVPDEIKEQIPPDLLPNIQKNLSKIDQELKSFNDANKNSQFK